MMSSTATTVSPPRRLITAKQRGFRISVLVWGLMILTFTTFRRRAPEELLEPGGIDMQAKFQVVAWILLGLLALRLVVNRTAELRLMLQSPLTWFCAFAGLEVISTLNSAAPALTLFRSGQVVILILLVVSLRENLDRIYYYIGFYLAANWLVFLAANSGINFGFEWVPGGGYDYMISPRNGQPWRFGSPMGHPSTVSIVGAAGACGLLARTYQGNKRENVPLILFFVVTVLLTISRTAIAGMLGGMLLVPIARRRAIPVVLLAAIVLPLVVMIPSVGRAVVGYTMRGQSAEDFRNFTGRDEIYSQGIARAREALPFGEGYVAGRAKMIVAKEKGSSIVHSHNLLIESTVGMGMFGLIVAIMVLLAWGVSLLRTLKIPPDETGISPGWEPMAMSAPLVAYCILDRGFAGDADPFLCVFVVVLTCTTKLLLTHKETWAGTASPIHH